MQNREQIVISILLTIYIVLGIIYYQMLLTTYWETPEYEKTLQSIHNLHNENMQLHDYYLEQKSYTNISRRAASEGFINAMFISL